MAGTAEEPVDVAVIGLGSAGENLAGRLASAGCSVVGFEPQLVGGECPFTACMPSKALLHHVTVGSDWPTARAHRNEVTDHGDDAQHAEALRDQGVAVVRAAARLVDERVVEADGRRFRAEHVVIATGGRPALPPVTGLEDDAPFWTSDDYLTADDLPDSLVVLGGGAIGCELATVHQHFGSSVTLVDHGSLLGADVDDEVADVVAALLRQRGVEVRTGAETTKAVFGGTSPGTGVTLSFDDGPDAWADTLLVATGKHPAWGGLGLDAVGIDDPGVDDELRVAGREWLWAIGDVNGRAPWTHGANHQARWLADRLTDDAWPGGRVDRMPHCVFTDPPIAAVGLTAATAREAGVDAVRGTSTYGDIARYATDQLAHEGLVVVVVDRDTRRLVGCSGTGTRFDDVVSTFSAWLHAGLTVDGALRSVLPFPTMTEVLEPALTDALDQL